MTLLERLRTLTSLDAIPGHEQPVVRVLRDALADLCDDVEVDAVGTLYAIRRGAEPGPTVLVAAHTDEIGMMVKHVDANGFLRFEGVGGIIAATLSARLVRVGGHLGVIGMRSGHYQSPDERSRVPAIADMTIDIGAHSAERVAELGIEVGTPISFASDLVEFGVDAPLVGGKAIDNRLGCAVLWEVLEGGPPPAGTLVAAFTSQEEVGLRGAGVAGERIRPDLALALDTMPSGDTPDMRFDRDLSVALGAGPALQVLAGPGGRSLVTHVGVKRYLQRTAARAGIPVQLNVFTGGNNDAAALAWSGTGVPAASLCIPRRYSHSPVEVADMRDAEATVRLLRAVVDDMGGLPAFGFLDS
jgi:putative aminopeptidase